MSDEFEERFNVTAEDIRRYDWASVIAACDQPECVHYFERLRAAARERDEADDKVGGRVFMLLSVVASFHPNYDASGNPYGSLWSGFNGKRALNAEDLTDADLLALGGVVDEVVDPELQARVADVLWVTKKDFKVAKLAITSFLASAARLKTNDMWPPYAERLERAARISVIRGFESEKAEVVKTLEEAIADYSTDLDSGLLCEKLMSILRSLHVGDPVFYAVLSERLAKQFFDARNWHFAECYWKGAAQWHRRAKSESEAQRCEIERAECYISQGEAGMPGRETNYMNAAHWVGKGLEALRRGKADAKRILDINKRLLELQELSSTEMTSIEVPVDTIPGFRDKEKIAQDAASKHVQGVNFQTAIARFSLIDRPTSWEQMKEQHAKTSESAPLSSMIGVTASDRSGKTTDFIPPEFPSDRKGDDESLRKRLVQQAQMVNWPIKVQWCIEPARLSILLEHGVRMRDLEFLVTDNPFIPPGHEGIYLRGIQAGFLGDWLVAMHLLVPQLETSIRYVLKQRDVITSTIDGEGIQKDKDLNELLFMPETEQIFGKDILFDLRGILIDRFGHNLRNELAHGLLPEAGFYHPAPVYLWWLVIHICWCSYRYVQSQVESPPSADGTLAETPTE